jgi:hypothetical protein
MRIRQRGAIVVVDSLVGVSLLTIDAWSRFSQLSTLPWWRYIQPWLPAVYGVCFLTAWLLMRAEYEAADYDFEIDPQTEIFYREFNDGSSRTHYRISVRNYGQSQITAQVLLSGLFPEPANYRGSLGMPLMAMTDPMTVEPIQINPGTARAFNLVSYDYDPLGVTVQSPDPRSVILWHNWPDAMYPLETDINYTFELTLTTAEGPAKTAMYQMRLKDGGEPGESHLTRVWASTIWNRLRRRTLRA